MLATRPSPISPGVVRWTACETYTWVAFREARPYGGNFYFPKSEWSLDWKDRPRTSVSRAFICIETGQDWEPDEWGGRGKEHYLAWARALMRDTRLDARRLNEMLTAHNERHGRNVDKLRQAFRDVMAAIREGRLTVWARPAFGPAKPNISAVHQALDPLLFEGPRAVSVTGCVDYADFDSNGFDRRPENDSGLWDYNGPWYDEVRFDAGQVQALWPCQSENPDTPQPDSVKKKRPQGLDYASADAPLLREALAGITSGTYRNATDAARALANRAVGAGNEESRMKRLLKGIQSRPGAEQD